MFFWGEFFFKFFTSAPKVDSFNFLDLSPVLFSKFLALLSLNSVTKISFPFNFFLALSNDPGNLNILQSLSSALLTNFLPTDIEKMLKQCIFPAVIEPSRKRKPSSSPVDPKKKANKRPKKKVTSSSEDSGAADL